MSDEGRAQNTKSEAAEHRALITSRFFLIDHN